MIFLVSKKAAFSAAFSAIKHFIARR